MNPSEFDPLIEQLQDRHDHREEYAILSGTDNQGEPTFTLDGDFTLAFLRDLVKLAEDHSPVPPPMATSSIQITLTLSVKEALWLKAQMQNPPPGEAPAETPIRHGIFLALPEFSKLENL